MLSHTARKARRERIAALAEKTREGDTPTDHKTKISNTPLLGSFLRHLKLKENKPERER